MYVVRKKKYGSKKTALIWLIVGLFCYFGYHILQGEYGVLNLFRLMKNKSELEKEISELELEKSRMSKKVGMLNSKSVDKDLLDEQVKRNLGYLNQGEKSYKY